MIELLSKIISNISVPQLSILFLLGLVLVLGTLGGHFFHKIKIPQVVGYIFVGLIIGETGFKIVDKELINLIEPLNYFALGLIGFMIGSELKKETLIKYGRQFTIILLGEGLAAFLFVSVLVGVFGYFYLHDVNTTLALALMLGAIASATAPAATTDVLWEYKSKGPLTTTVLGIVALDDGLALILFAITASIASALLGYGSSVLTILHPIYEICTAIAVGVVSGYILSKIVKAHNEEDRILALALGTVLLILGISIIIKVDIILTSMSLGVMLVNYAPRKSKEIFKLVGKFTPPIYVMFFVLFGAKLEFSHVTLIVIIIAMLYLFGRTAGKMFGAYFGAYISGASESIKKYLPFCLFSQAGVAIGLSLMVGHRFPGEIGNQVVIVITVTTFIVQLIGPMFVKYAIQKANEAGLNITEEDLIKKSKAKDIMDQNAPLILQNMTLMEVLKIFSEHDYLYYPVIKKDKVLVGIISISSIRHTFGTTGLDNVILAHDLMQKVVVTCAPETSMLDVKESLRDYKVDCMPVVSENKEYKGMIEDRAISRLVSKRMMELQSKIDALG
ncbi:MAG: cation:proton antiporter [Elusimicrobiota bacterium]